MSEEDFDTIDTELLLCKLPFYEIRGKALDLITSYLTDRQQCVRLSQLVDNGFKRYQIIELFVEKGHRNRYWFLFYLSYALMICLAALMRI